MIACRETGMAQVMQEAQLTLDSTILEGGSNLSIGERQLLSLTRVLLKNPAILILDEATANIDPAHEVIIQQAVGRIMKNRTCLIIAHRLSTIRHADNILVLEGGEIAEEGSHEKLMQTNGHYAEFLQIQERAANRVG